MANATYNTGDLLPTTALSAVPRGTGMDPFFGVDIVTCLNRIYFLQESQNPRVFDGTTMNLMSGTAVGTFTCAAITASGSGYTADFLYTAVYYDPDDIEFCTTGPWADLTTEELFRSVSLSAQDAIMTISDPPSSEPRLTRARIYRSLDQTADMRQLTGTGTYSDITVTPGGGGVHGFTDSGNAVPDSTLATRDPLNLRKRYFADGLPPASHTGCFYEGRLWMVDPANGNLIYSEVNLPEDFPTDNFVTILPSDQDPVPWPVALRVNNDQLMAYTEQGCYLIAGSGSPFRVRALYRGVGPVSTQACIYADAAGVIFPAQDAVYVHPGGSEVSRLGAPRSWPGMNPLNDLYQAIDKGNAHLMSAFLDRERTLFTLAAPLADGDAVCPGGFEWDYNKSNWGRLSNRVMTALGSWANVQGRPWPVFGDELGGIWQAELGNYEGVPGFPCPVTVAIVAPYINIGAGSGQAASWSVLGAPFVIITGATGAVLQRNRIVNYTATGDGPMAYLYPLESGFLTDGTQSVTPGAIEAIWESGWWSLTKEQVKCHLSYIYAYFGVVDTDDGAVRILCGVDQNETLRAAADLCPTDENTVKIPFNDFGAQAKFRIENSAPGVGWSLYGADINVTTKRYRI